MENSITITRKYTLYPELSERKEWTKKVTEFILNSYDKKIEKCNKEFEKANTKKEKTEIKEKLNDIIAEKQNFLENKVITQKIVTDYTYDMVRESMKSESARKNMIISYVFSELINKNAQSMDYSERNKLIDDIVSYCCRIKGSKKESILDIVDIENPLGAYGFRFSQILKNKIKDMVNNDRVLEGKSSIISYKEDSPFTVSKSDMGFSHNYENFGELRAHITDSDCRLYFNFGGNGNPTIAKFRIVMGQGRKKENKEELISTLLKIYSGEYEFCGSSIGIENRKIILNLSMKIPKQLRKLDENTVVGVDLGVAVPAMCALNNNLYVRERIGSADEFLRVRTKLQSQRKRMQSALKNASGGHGRSKKLKALEKLKSAEDNFVTTYCHMVSKRVVDFALKHNAKYINIENLNGYDTSDFILRNWSFYKLQQDIIYKAEKYGIEVRKVNPCYTSQVCSVCGHWEEGQRKSQSVFECFDKDCKSHEIYKYGFNADFNAARNIAKSELFMKNNSSVTEESKQGAREYYKI